MANSKPTTYAERMAAKRNKRLRPSMQALAARGRAAQRNREAADLRVDRLTTLASNGDAVATQLLQVTR